MSDIRHAEIKSYIARLFVSETEAMQMAKQRAKSAELPNIAVPENVGKLLSFFAKLQKPKRILEIGTQAGYSTLWLAQGAPDAEILTLECDPACARLARENFQAHPRIQVIEGDALETLRSFITNKAEPFDLIFLDADKEGYPIYLPYLVNLARPGTLLLTDNLIPKAEPIDNPAHTNQIATQTYIYNKLLAAHPKLDTILIPTIVGEQGRIDALGISYFN